MRYTRYRSRSFYSGYFPPGVKWLLIANIGIYLISFFADKLFHLPQLFEIFALVPAQVVLWGYVWQVVTYMFLHGGMWHVIFNMLGLWFFGPPLERDWGTKRFLQYYFLCGVGAAVCVILLAFAVDEMRGNPGEAALATIGASGALFGILLAYGMLYPDAMVLYDFLFPIKAKYFVMIVGAVAFLGSFTTGSGISHIAHLGGMIFGYAFLKSGRKRSTPRRANWLSSLHSQYHEWKVQRARRKFQVYMRKHGNDRDEWPN